MEKIIADLALMGGGVFVAFATIGSSIGAADGGPNPAWAWPAFIVGLAMFLLGGGLLSAKIIVFLLGLWR